MPYQFFHDLFPEIAEAETRSIILSDDDPETGLPADAYGFGEMFCNEPRCDCRRVLFYVVCCSRIRMPRPEAVIAWGWESREFYAKWLHRDDPEAVSNLIGPVLNSTSPQGKFADALLRLTHEVLLRDEEYVARIKRHYRLFRDRIDNRTGTAPWKKPRNKKR